jgi:enterochelin esterase-like enzyme
LKQSQEHNPTWDSHALYYDPTHLQMKPMMDSRGNMGPMHVFDHQGVQVRDNGDVVFTMFAPHAKKVEVAGIGGEMSKERHAMHMNPDGYWQVEVSGIPEGFHYHEYFIDDSSVINPQAPVGYGCHRVINFFEKPGENSDFYAQKPVPHGDVRMEYYDSSCTGRTRVCWVYTPPGYSDASEKTYPVLYLHHGGGENETGWIWHGKMNYILDNLLAEGRCAEMIVVMNSIYAVDESAENIAGDYDSVLMKDCIPFIEKKYRVDTRGEKRGIAGLSMGSYQSLMTGTRHLGDFAWIGIFSGSLKRRWYCDFDHDAVFDRPDFAEKVRLFFLGVGQQEQNIYQDTLDRAALLEAKHCPVTLYTCPGYHEWTVWRKCLLEFAQLAFR